MVSSDPFLVFFLFIKLFCVSAVLFICLRHCFFPVWPNVLSVFIFSRFYFLFFCCPRFVWFSFVHGVIIFLRYSLFFFFFSFWPMYCLFFLIDRWSWCCLVLSVFFCLWYCLIFFYIQGVVRLLLSMVLSVSKFDCFSFWPVCCLIFFCWRCCILLFCISTMVLSMFNFDECVI